MRDVSSATWIVLLAVAAAGIAACTIAFVELASAQALVALGLLLAGAGVGAIALMTRYVERRSLFLLQVVLFFNIVFVDVGVLSPQRPANSMVHPQIIAKLLVYGVTFVISAVLLRTPIALPGFLLCLGYGALCTISALWSAQPMFTFSAGCILIAHVVLGAALASHTSSFDDQLQILRTAFWALLVKALSSWVILVLAPSIALLRKMYVNTESPFWSLPRLGGLAGPNTTGLNAALLFSVAAGLSLTSSKARWLRPYLWCAGFGGITAIATQSRSALLAMAVAVPVALYLELFRRQPAVAIATGILVAAAVLFVNLEPEQLARATSRTGDVQEVVSLAGRTHIWKQAMGLVVQQPFLGYGYGSGRWLIPALTVATLGQSFQSAHNMWIELALNCGVVAVFAIGAILVITLVYFVRTLAGGRHRDRAQRAVVFTGLLTVLVLMVNGLAESGIGGIQTMHQVLLFWLLISSGKLAGLTEPDRAISVLAVENSARTARTRTAQNPGS